MDKFKTINLDITNPFYVKGTRLFLLKKDESLFVVKDYCKHRGGPLSLGKLDINGDKIICPWHGSKSCILELAKIALPTIRLGNTVTFRI